MKAMTQYIYVYMDKIYILSYVCVCVCDRGMMTTGRASKSSE